MSRYVFLIPLVVSAVVSCDLPPQTDADMQPRDTSRASQSQATATEKADPSRQEGSTHLDRNENPNASPMSPDSHVDFQPRSISVVNRSYKIQLPEGTDYPQYPFEAELGTEIGILITTPGRLIASISSDYDDFVIKSFVDDSGRDLLRDDDGDHQVVVSPDFRAAMLTYSVPSIPAPQASRLTLAGSLKISTASGIETHKSPALSLKVGATTQVAGFDVSIDEAKPYEFDDGFSLSFSRTTTAAHASTVARMYFVDKDHKRIACRHSSSSAVGTEDETELTDSFDFDETVTTAILVFETWKDRAATSVPFNVSSTLGGG